MVKWSRVLRNGFVATAVMELFYRVTNLLFHHGLDVPYANGAIFSFQSKWMIYLTGYCIFLLGGVVFAYLYERFIRAKSYASGMIYAVFFVWLIVDGFLFEPMGSAGILMLQAGINVVLVNLLAHTVFGLVLGGLSARDKQTA